MVSRVGRRGIIRTFDWLFCGCNEIKFTTFVSNVSVVVVVVDDLNSELAKNPGKFTSKHPLSLYV